MRHIYSFAARDKVHGQHEVVEEEVWVKTRGDVELMSSPLVGPACTLWSSSRLGVQISG